MQAAHRTISNRPTIAMPMISIVLIGRECAFFDFFIFIKLSSSSLLFWCYASPLRCLQGTNIPGLEETLTNVMPAREKECGPCWPRQVLLTTYSSFSQLFRKSAHGFCRISPGKACIDPLFGRYKRFSGKDTITIDKWQGH